MVVIVEGMQCWMEKEIHEKKHRCHLYLSLSLHPFKRSNYCSFAQGGEKAHHISFTPSSSPS